MADPQQNYRDVLARLEAKDKEGTSAQDLTEPAYGIGAFMSLLAPSAGVSDVLGYAPDPFKIGDTMPSFSENIQSGNYLDAGLQTLGASGDVMLAASPFFPALMAPAAAVKGISALGKSLKGLKIDPKFQDLNTEELISSYIIQPKISDKSVNAVSREELASKLVGDQNFQDASNKALDLKGFKDTVPIYRIITNKPEAMNIGKEKFVSGLVDKSKIFKLHNFLTEGKSSIYDSSYLLRYDVPRDKIAGYLPSYSDKITKKINKKIKEKGIGQKKISGFETVTNPAKFTKSMLESQDEIIADVSGLEPKILKTEGFSDNKPLDLKSGNSRFIDEIVQGNIKNPKDLQNYAASFSFSKNVKSIADIVPVTKDPNAQKYIDEVKEFFKTKPTDDSALAFSKIDTPVYHFSMEPGFSKFDLDKLPFSDLGPHVGSTPKAAADRFFTKNYGIMPDLNKRYEGKTTDEILKDIQESGIKPDNPDFLGGSVPLKADLSKPFLNPATKKPFTETELTLYKANQLGRLSNNKFTKDDLYFENPNVSDDDIRQAMRKLSRELAEKGFTHIPYVNDFEDVKELSYVMLLDRPKGSSKVLQSPFAKKDPAAAEDPDIMKEEGGVVSMKDIAVNMTRKPQGIEPFIKFVV